MLTCRTRPTTRTCALITGASSGIGAAFARELPAETRLVLVGRRDEALAAVAGELTEQGRDVATVTADLATSAGRDAVIEAGEANRIDMLINNAGLGSFGPFLDNPRESERAALEVNVVALTELTRALTPAMLARASDGGARAALVNVASTAAFVPVPKLAVYAASKAYVLSFTEALTAELRGAPIDVLAVCPGAARTSFGARAGFDPGSLPGAKDPRTVARRALGDLGRVPVAFTDLLSRGILGQVAAARTVAAAALGFGTDVAARFAARQRG